MGAVVAVVEAPSFSGLLGADLDEEETEKEAASLWAAACRRRLFQWGFSMSMVGVAAAFVLERSCSSSWGGRDMCAGFQKEEEERRRRTWTPISSAKKTVQGWKKRTQRQGVRHTAWLEASGGAADGFIIGAAF